MANEPYSTGVYPYPAAMWDEAADHLATKRGWATVLITCPDPAGTVATATQEMENRGLSDTYALVYEDSFSESCIIRVSRLQYVDPRWDAIEDTLKDPNNRVALLGIDLNQVTADAMIIEAKAAMLERGFEVAVGYAADLGSNEGLLRIELA